MDDNKQSTRAMGRALLAFGFLWLVSLFTAYLSYRITGHVPSNDSFTTTLLVFLMYKIYQIQGKLNDS